MFDIDTCLAYITGYSAKKINDAVNEFCLKKGITHVQWTALYYVGKYENISQKELANLMNLKPSSVARLIDRMEKEEYLTRHRSLEDKRVFNLKLTNKGNNLREEMNPEAKKLSEIIRHGISDEHIAIFKNVLNTMSENVSKEKKCE
ncbi:MAG: MarR family transcriptional regulator [Tissierellia bacterium]|nr:MarR family transcriptional regulator [Tissierellia bacterium]MDD4781109.1 MarR family transcriptional regulator [Tissierellia bacterium]